MPLLCPPRQGALPCGAFPQNGKQLARVVHPHASAKTNTQSKFQDVDKSRAGQFSTWHLPYRLETRSTPLTEVATSHYVGCRVGHNGLVLCTVAVSHASATYTRQQLIQLPTQSRSQRNRPKLLLRTQWRMLTAHQTPRRFLMRIGLWHAALRPHHREPFS